MQNLSPYPSLVHQNLLVTTLWNLYDAKRGVPV